MPIRISSPWLRTQANKARYPARVVAKLPVPNMVPVASTTAATWTSLWVSTPANTGGRD